jgi:hypothetical protein
VKRTLSILVLAACAIGCEPDARNDANLFLDRVRRIDLDDPVEERRRLVDSLASLPLSAEPVQRARDACVEAHRTILEAEELHARARSAVEEHEDESQMPITERQRIERDIQESNRAIERSREMFTRCHRLTRDLELRYRSRRGRGEE